MCRRVEAGEMCMCLCFYKWMFLTHSPPLSQTQREIEMRSVCGLFVCVCVCCGGAERGSWVTPGIQPHLTLINWPGILLSLLWQKGRLQSSAASSGMIRLSFFCLSYSFSVPIIASLSTFFILAVSRWRRHTPQSFAKLAQITGTHESTSHGGRGHNAVHCFLTEILDVQIFLTEEKKWRSSWILSVKHFMHSVIYQNWTWSFWFLLNKWLADPLYSLI